MIYRWDTDLHVINNEDKVLFTNIKKQKWLRVSKAVKEEIDKIIDNELQDIDKNFEEKVLGRLIKNNIIVTENDIKAIDENPQGLNSIYFVLTEKCNMECEFCYLSSGPQIQEKTILDFDKIKHAFDRLATIGVRQVLLTGGEPLLRPGFFEIVNYLSAKFSLILQTNGLLLTDNLIDQLENKVKTIEISTEHIFDNENYKEHIINRLEYMKEKNIKKSLSFVVTKKNKKYIKEFLDLCAKYNTAISLKLVDLAGRAKLHNELALSEENIIELYKTIYNYIYEKEYYNIERFESFLFPLITPRYSCSAVDKILAIIPDGKVYSCHSMRYDDFYLGDLTKNTIDDILKESKCKGCTSLYEKFFNIDKRNICSNCDIRYYCTGACAASLFQNGKLKENTLSDDCKIRKEVINFILWEYMYKKSKKENMDIFLSRINSM